MPTVHAAIPAKKDIRSGSSAVSAGATAMEAPAAINGDIMARTSTPTSLENTTPSEGLSGQALVDWVVRRLEEDKVEDIVVIPLAGKSDVADAMIVASGRSQRHVGAVADHLHRELKDLGNGNVPLEGMPSCDWVLLDVGDVIVHLFRPEVREFYNLERIWAPEGFRDSAEAH